MLSKTSNSNQVLQKLHLKFRLKAANAMLKFLFLLIVKSISCRFTYFTSQRFTLFKIYLYLKGERALLGNLVSRKILPSIQYIVSQYCSSPISLSLHALSPGPTCPCAHNSNWVLRPATPFVLAKGKRNPHESSRAKRTQKHGSVLQHNQPTRWLLSDEFVRD
jgi:hypothetical protein